ncbi:hypothetical protein JYU34_011565 [Plutella xylostella]|uniref:CCHC-type domain-containing protein n=1 Tax=Plutella xylostella TaxID=51655 RepID=A0ABQ7QH96_PLUXY|nr:hypothetical protein JYU34_011565 [Plutella xylostella]
MKSIKSEFQIKTKSEEQSDSESESTESDNSQLSDCHPKMTDKITLNVLTKFIKPYNGDTATLPAFLTNCENAISLASQEQQTFLFKFIISQLEGKAQVACSLKSFEEWSELKTFLKSTFGERKHESHLLIDVQTCKQHPSESISQYVLRFESCLTRLQAETQFTCEDKSELKGRIATTERVALNAFMLGINSNIAFIVRCRNPKNLSEAITHALEEEKLHNLSKISFKPAKECTICHKKGHNNSECYRVKNNQGHRSFHINAPSPSSSRNIPVTQNSNFNSNNNIKSCRYCKNMGHTIDECRKRKYNMQRRENTNYAQRDHNPPRVNSSSINFCDANNESGSNDNNLN